MESPAEQEIFLLIALATAIMLALAIALIFFYGQSQRRLLMQRVEGQKLILQKTIMAQEEERRRIAKDLHDEIGSKLSVIFLHAKIFQKSLSQTPSFQSKTQALIDVVNQTIGQTRRISHDLLPPTLEEFGLIPALKELQESYNKTTALEINLKISEVKKIDLEKVISLNLFRISQELISNSVKHGAAKEINIHLLHTHNKVQILYEDNGKGFDALSSEQSKGLGMKNIESRLQIINGSWTYQSEKGKGLQAEIIVKL